MAKMDLILVGHPGSQCIVPASKYLVEKYLPFKAHWLNWVGDIKGWSNFVGSYLAQLDCEFVIFTLDDYLVSGFNEEAYREALKKFEDKKVMCVKLHKTDLEEHRGYPVTTQYTIWRREFLIDLLCITHDPWHFEITGSDVFMGMGLKSVFLEVPAITYNTSSCLSARWRGVDLKGVNPEDMETINKLI